MFPHVCLVTWSVRITMTAPREEAGAIHGSFLFPCVQGPPACRGAPFLFFVL